MPSDFDFDDDTLSNLGLLPQPDFDVSQLRDPIGGPGAPSFQLNAGPYDPTVPGFSAFDPLPGPSPNVLAQRAQGAMPDLGSWPFQLPSGLINRTGNTVGGVPSMATGPGPNASSASAPAAAPAAAGASTVSKLGSLGKSLNQQQPFGPVSGMPGIQIPQSQAVTGQGASQNWATLLAGLYNQMPRRQ